MKPIPFPRKGDRAESELFTWNSQSDFARDCLLLEYVKAYICIRESTKLLTDFTVYCKYFKCNLSHTSKGNEITLEMQTLKCGNKLQHVSIGLMLLRKTFNDFSSSKLEMPQIGIQAEIWRSFHIYYPSGFKKHADAGLQVRCLTVIYHRMEEWHIT